MWEWAPVDTADEVHPGTRTPAFAAPGLVLLATIAIYEGYHWLRLIPDGTVRPAAVVLAVIAVPATFGLTRRISGPGTERLRTVAHACAVLLPVLWTVALLAHSDIAADLLGADSLALALSLVALAVLSEIGEHQHTGSY
jgi:hypothetical protein